MLISSMSEKETGYICVRAKDMMGSIRERRINGGGAKDILGTPTPIRFEDEEVWGVQKYDAYLSQKYGDYKTIPKQSGLRQHNFHYLDLNKPYRNFEV